MRRSIVVTVFLAAGWAFAVPRVAAGPATPCTGTKASIGGRATCLVRNARCTRSFDAQYHRYAFHCHAGRLVYDETASIRRPLYLPALGPSGNCPLTAPAQLDVSEYGLTNHYFGGPSAFVNLQGWPEASIAVAFPSTFGDTPWSGQKVPWFVEPGVRGKIVLIRGRQLDGPNAIGFGQGTYPLPELKLSGALFHPATARFRAAGCYALQADGTTFSETIVFRVDAISR